MEIKICPYCGKEFKANSRRKHFCSIVCNSRYYGEQNKKTRICKRCNEQFWTPDASKKRSRYCPTCAILNIEDAKRKRIDKETKNYVVKTCSICGIEFKTTYTNKILCGNEQCKKRYNATSSYENSRKKKALKKYNCKVCGVEFSVEYGNKERAYCCEEHKNIVVKQKKRVASKQYQAKRKKQMKTAFVERVYIKKLYERDNGLCGICGRPVEYDKSPENKWALTCDHIIPISKNGKHCMDNCQIAHRICNSYKLDYIDFHIDWSVLEKMPKKEWSKYLYNRNS